MARERIAFLASKDSKIIDDKYIHFGTKDGKTSLGTYDARLGYDSSEQRLTLTCVRPSATSPAYAVGLQIDADDLVTGTGAVKTRILQIEADRTSAVMGGDANDQGIVLSMTNRAVNTPAGSYQRGLSVSMNNRASGTITGIQGGFISARQRGDGGAIGHVRGLQIDTVLNVGGAAPSSQVEGLRLEFQLEANCPTYADATGGVGILIDQRTDGMYTLPGAAVAVRNRGTSGCKGWSYGIDFLDTRAATCDIAEIRFMTRDANGLPAIHASGTATDDAGIVSDIGADTLWADGSLYSSIVDGAGKLFVKTNDVWTSCI